MLSAAESLYEPVTCPTRQTVHNIQHTQNFTVIGNSLLQDFSLSDPAYRILTYLLSLPKDWKIYQSHLVKRTGKKPRTIQRYMTELRRAGYVTYTRLARYDSNNPTADQGYYRVYEVPQDSLRGREYIEVDGASANDAPPPRERPVADPDRELRALIAELEMNHIVKPDDKIFLERKSNHWFSTLTVQYRQDSYFGYMKRGYQQWMREQCRDMKVEHVKDQKTNELCALIQAQADQLRSKADSIRSHLPQTLEQKMSDDSWDIDGRGGSDRGPSDIGTVFGDDDGPAGSDPEHQGYVIDV